MKILRQIFMSVNTNVDIKNVILYGGKIMNNRFAEYLESAIDKAEQAVSNISYSSYPEINKEVIAKIEKAIALMEDVLDMEIFRP